MPRPPDMTDFDAWMRDVHARIADDRHDWNSMALGFLVARGADYRVTDDWELLSAFTCGDKPRAEAAIAVATRAWLAHDWCDRCGDRAPYRASFVDAARDNDPPADVDVAAWVRSLDDAAWEAARAATPTGRGGNARSQAARAHLDAVASAGRERRLEAFATARKARRIAEMRASLNLGAELPPCADPEHPERLCNAHDRGYPADYECASEGVAPTRRKKGVS